MKKHSKIDALKAAVKLSEYAKQFVDLSSKGGELWGCCPFHEESTPSFAIKLKGTDEIFYCQGCGKGGDIIRFVEMKEGLSTRDAIEKLAGVAGLGRSERREVVEDVPPPQEPEWNENFAKVAGTLKDIGAEKKKTVPLDKWPALELALQNAPEALAWLLNVRGITQQTAKDLRLGFVQDCKGNLKEEDEGSRAKGWVLFPRISNGKIVACKMRSIISKAFSQWGGMDGRALFNIETINSLEPVFVTEGELDTAVMEQAGFRAVSIPSASNHKLMPDAKHRLKQAAAIYLAGDNDGGVGNVAMEQLAIELGKGTYVIKWQGAKDANELFLKGCGGDVDKFRKVVEEHAALAERTPVIGFTNILDQLAGEKETSDMENDPDRLHWQNAQIDKLAYTPPGGVVIIYSTYTGTGKSVLVNQELAVHEAKRGEVVISFSPELADRAFLSLLAAQVYGSTLPEGLDRSGKITPEQYSSTAALLRPTYAAEGKPCPPHWHPKTGDDTIRFYVGYKLPDGGMDKVLEFIEYAIRATGATRFVIDTLNRLIIPEDGENETAAQGRCVKALEAIAKAYGCIFILIGQSNKESDSVKEIRKDEYGTLRGSRELQDVAYAIYLLHRKKSDRNDNTGLLSPEAELLLNKGRIQGSGNIKRIPLLYKYKCSIFVMREEHSNEPDAPPIQSEYDGQNF